MSPVKIMLDTWNKSPDLTSIRDFTDVLKNCFQEIE